MKCAFGYVTQQDNLGFYSYDKGIYEDVPVFVYFFYTGSNRWSYISVY